MTRERVEPGIWRRGEVFEITWRDAQAKQRRKTVQGGITAARKALADAKSKRDRGERTSDPRLTFNAAADAWWAARVVKLRPDHADRRQRRAAAPSGRLLAGFGLTRLADIGPTEVARYVSQRDAKALDRQGRE